jgi:hypothetical protein
MILELRFDPGRVRHWMKRAVQTLAKDNAALQVRWTEGGPEKPRGLDFLFELERMLLRRGVRGGAEAASRDEVDAGFHIKGDPDAVIDFSSATAHSGEGPARMLTPLYNGVAGEDGILNAVLSGDLPCIEIIDERGEVVASGRPSAENAAGLSGALDTIMARTMTLLTGAMAGRQRVDSPKAQPAAREPRSPAMHVASGLVSALAREIYRLCCYAPHWHVGWRFVDDDGVWQRDDLSGAAWNVVPDPAVHFYADPFPVTWQGRTFVFIEELDHRIGKGYISAIEFDANGPVGRARPVLEENWHLSYPFLIEHAGELWMIPESMANHDVAIYRCIAFPDKWERSATLLSGVELSDATITHHNGMYYLFGAQWDGLAGFSDTLSIYHSPDLFGPWRPHAENPVLVDRSSARPAGNFVKRNGRLWRPAQDCAQSYGGGLLLAEVLELSPTAFRQRPHKYLKPGEYWPGRKLHTLNRAGRLEVIDGSKIQPKLRSLATRP